MHIGWIYEGMLHLSIASGREVRESRTRLRQVSGSLTKGVTYVLAYR